MLLDALTALEGHLDNLVLVGAQAVYHHTGDADLNVPLMTTDADLAVNTRDLADAPEIGGVLRAAGFTPGPNPGHWVNIGEVAVDLMVVPHQAGTAKASARAARLAPHEKLTARIARGLEPALVDNALDAFRILQAIDTDVLVRGFARHRDDEHAAAVSDEAIEVYRLHASIPQGRIAQLAAGAVPSDRSVAPAYAALVDNLLTRL